MHSPALSSYPMLATLRRMIRRIGPLGTIILLHVGFFYALQSGLLRQAAQAALPTAVYVSFITPEQPKPAEPPKPKPQPPKPKTVPVVKKAAPPPKPIVNNTPSERAISTPPTPPAPPAPEPAEPVVAAAPPAPPAPAAPAQPRLISSGIEYIQPPQPVYPAVARRMGEEGKVVMRVLVNERGRPERVDIQTSSGSSRLDDAARQAAMRAVFKPHIENGRPVAVFALIPIRFQLDS